MSKYKESISLSEAVEIICAHINPITEIESLPLLKAGNRILARDMVTEFDNPPFDKSPIDGYACKASDLSGASPDNPAVLKVVEEIDAGGFSYREIKAGEAVRIMTGAAIPKGCDCCIFQEDTNYGEDTVEIYKSIGQWGNYCFAGEDFKKGTTLLKKGTKLGFVELGVLAGMGISEVPVYRRPRIGLLTTGDEVVEPGNALPPGKIYNSNLTLMAARLAEWGMDLTYVRDIPDDEALLSEAIDQASKKADFIVTTGGVSVGKRDILHPVLEALGAERIFWRVKIKPGMPTLFTEYKGIPILSLSGNPFGVAVTAEVMLRPALERLSGDSSLALRRKTAILQDQFPKKVGGLRYIRAYYEDGRVHLNNGLHSNGVLSSMTGCNCLIEATSDTPHLAPGTRVTVVML